ncbi:hypothetical protein BDV39DRAFT_173720 [Aspergillus sergii]|uniref:Uncharacterized protein n=1 Tax=Aspergillus sergii TaxID=1034303 RepID=A0A5N6X9B1_9EURO|nr:hypothetical protein BDV39DRAFT_173720 [Aspergillus sergii]
MFSATFDTLIALGPCSGLLPKPHFLLSFCLPDDFISVRPFFPAVEFNLKFIRRHHPTLANSSCTSILLTRRHFWLTHPG